MARLLVAGKRSTVEVLNAFRGRNHGAEEIEAPCQQCAEDVADPTDLETTIALAQIHADMSCGRKAGAA